MLLADVTFAVFTLFNALQIVSYIPQTIAVIKDPNGASAISYSSWTIWLAGAAATTAYALINIWDIWLALINAVHAVCCLAVILLTACKRSNNQSAATAATDI